MHDCSKDSNRPHKYTPRALPPGAPSLKIFAHCDERPKALPLETASIFLKLLDQKTLRFKKFFKDFFDSLEL